MAALNAKKQGDLEQARNHLKTSKVLCFKRENSDVTWLVWGACY
jgi:hypothetical protein